MVTERRVGRPKIDLVGMRFGSLTVIAEAPSRKSPTGDRLIAWTCVCDCGVQRDFLRGHLRSGGSRSCGCRGRRKGVFKKDVVGYHALHARVRTAKGRASEHPCVDCGYRAREWSYIGGDPDELEQLVRGQMMAYSLDLDRYEPRCLSCHRAFDVWSYR